MTYVIVMPNNIPLTNHIKDLKVNFTKLKCDTCHGNFGPGNFGPGPKFPLENMVRPLKNRSRLKTLILGLFLKQENIKRRQINEGKPR